MVVMTKRLRIYAWNLMLHRDGSKRCAYCGRRPVKKGEKFNPKKHAKNFVIDHINNEKTDNPLDGSNWNQACKSCNTKKDHKHHSTSPKFNKHIEYKQYIERKNESERRVPRELEKGEEAEQFFRGYVKKTFETLKEVSEKILVNSGKEEFNRVTGKTISQQALGTYLDAMTNPLNGRYECFPRQDPTTEKDIWFVRKKKQ